MNSNDFLKEGFVEDAHIMHQDHEVQMAREECYHAAENAIALHKLLRNISEQQGLEGWVSAKITLAGDYLKTVREYLEYELMSAASEQPMLPIAENRDDDYDDEEPVLYSGCYVRDKEDQSNEVFIMRGSPEDRRVQITDRNGSGWNISPSRLVAVDDSDPAITKYFDKGMAEGSLNELSADLLQRSAQVAKNKSNQAMDPKIHDELGGGYMNPLAKHYDSLSQKFSNKAVKVGQRDAVKKIASPAVMRKIGMAEQGVVEEVTEMSAGSVAGVVNPAPKNKAKVGTLFGGTYKQKKTKA